MAKGELPGMSAEIASRRAEFEKYRNVLTPKFLKGRVEFDDTWSSRATSLKVAGTSASPGVATGPVRVVESIDEIRAVRSGEILVTSNTDPGWTPVFSQLAGLITETGGILSHGAVVSREYGIPAVTAVKGAKQIFKTGQRITVDGNEGVIYLLEE
jgi:pyruvate,water dikinase